MRLLPAVDGGKLFEVNLSKNRRESSYKARFFTQYSQVFDTSRGGGIGGPNTPVSALGSPVNFTPNLSLIKIQTTTRAGFTIIFT